MSEARYKEALNKLDSGTRTCIRYLENEVKEIKVVPLTACQELEKKVLKTLSHIEKHNRILEERIDIVIKLQDELMEQTPTVIEKRKKECIQEITELYNKYMKDFEKIQDVIDERNKDVKRINKDLRKFFRDKKFEDRYKAPRKKEDARREPR